MSRIPDFIYVGSPKAGSTWLFDALRDHPEVFVLPSKSSGYFETSDPGPIEAYLARFASAERTLAAGEIAHDAYLFDDTAQRLRREFPGIKILICLREPQAFAASVLKWWSTHTVHFGRTPDAMARHPHFRKLMDYPSRLAPFFEHFPHEQIKVMFFDDLERDATVFYNEICIFLGVDPKCRPSVLDTIVNPARAPRFRPVTQLVYAGGGVARAMGLGNTVERLKRAAALDRLMYRSPAQADSPLLNAEAAKAGQMARQQLAALEDLLKRPLPPAWRQTPEP